MTLQRKATLVSSSVAALLTLIKLIVGIMSGSVGVLASAIDSILDLFVSMFNYFAISNAEKPADSRFNYGRGKIEALAAVIEGTIIAISGLYIFYEATNKYLYDIPTQHLDISIWVMLISLVITISLVIFLQYVAKKTGSMVIKSDALHYKTDVWSNLAVLISLIAVFFTELDIIDVIVGAIIGVYIIYSAYELIREGVLILLDESLEIEHVEHIKEIITSKELVTDYHWLKTRSSGSTNFVDVHVVFFCTISLLEAHRVSDQIEAEIKALDESKDWIMNIHLDPYDDAAINEQDRKNVCEIQ